MGDPWGISGPTFLLAYGVITLVVVVVGTRARREIAGEGPDRPPDDLAAHPYAVAYLADGAELAVYAALGSMHRAGTVATAGPGRVRAVGRLPEDANELERAIHVTATGGVHYRRLPFHTPVVAALRSIEDHLTTAGLLLSADQQRRIRAVGWWMVGVALFGLVRLLAGVANAQPEVVLVPTLLIVTAIALVQLTHAPRRSRLGDAALADLRRDHAALAPTAAGRPLGDGPATTALGVGVFGKAALWAAEPVFAAELDAGDPAGPGEGVARAGSGCGWERA